MFTASRLQACTYLLGICLFSIAFLVFLNSSVSFVITSLIKQTTHVGDAVGTLGFADELGVIVACPAWGVVSDRLGVRTVCALGYAIIGFALLLFVQAKNVFPQLLLVRLLFSIGGAATSTMVTAILPSMTAKSACDEELERSSVRDGQRVPPSITSDITITPKRLQDQSDLHPSSTGTSPTRLAGVVGFFTGCGALLALGFFLRLPELLQKTGVPAEQALAETYYAVGFLSFILSLLCYIGLRHLEGEEGKGWRTLISRDRSKQARGVSRGLSSFKSLFKAIRLGFRSTSLGLGYMGGFVARASSVGISLFIPLFVNSYYISSGRCDEEGRNPQDIKETCRGAYVLAAELTGISQVIALIFAPIFGYVAGKYPRFNVPLIGAAAFGVLGYIGLATLHSPEIKGAEGTLWVIVIMALLGISQIGAIVCSLGLLGHGILEVDVQSSPTKTSITDAMTNAQGYGIDSDRPASAQDLAHGGTHEEGVEETPLLTSQSFTRDRLKGSIAGIYSLAGGLGILLLTKIGGLLFDSISIVAPFYMLALFNGLLFVAVIFISIIQLGRER